MTPRIRRNLALATLALSGIGVLVAAAPSSRPLELSPIDVQRTVSGGASRWDGEKISVEGVVTAVSPHGRFYYIADPRGGEWSGLKVYGPSLSRTVGEFVTVLGEVQEFFGETRLAERSSFSAGTRDLPEPSTIEVRDLIVNAERWEGVLVRVENVTVVEETNRYGEFLLRDAAQEGGMVDDEFFHSYIAEPGDTFASITGPVSYGFGDFRIEPRSDEDLESWTSVNVFDAEIAFTVHDEFGAPLPSKVTFTAVGGPAVVLGPDDRAEGTWDVAYLKAGGGTVPVPSGTYDVVISRGIEYGLYEERVSVGPGGWTPVSATLLHEVDSTGWISGDFHLHCAPSSDTPLPVPGRIMSLASEGVEWAVATDHNMVTDYSPVIERLGLSEWLTSSIGDEISTREPSYGHFNAWPLEAGREPVRYWSLSPAALFEAAHADRGADVVQVNHPVIVDWENQYFQIYDVNPFTGMPGESGFSFDFDALEIMNGRYIGQGIANFEIWMQMQNNGHRITATGNSDSHHLVYSEPGYPRNYVRSSTDAPASVREDEFVQSVLAGDTFVTYGPILDFQVNGEGLGRTVATIGDLASFDVRVQCPSWLRVTEGKIYANGEVVATFAIEGAASVPLDVQWRGSHAPERDTWYLLFVEGEGDLAPVRRGRDFRPLAFTNPIFVDVDGDGKFTPPGSFGAPNTVAETDAVDERGVPLLLGDWVVLVGCARTDTRFLDASSGIFYLEDETGGVQIREEVGALTEVRRGDRVRAAGYVRQVLGETIISEALVEILAGEAICPAPVDIATGELSGNVEALEGTVVRVVDAQLTGGSWPVAGAGGSVTIDDGTGAATLVIPSGVVVPPEAAAMTVFGVTALVAQRDFAAPFDSGYRLTLRSGDDLLSNALRSGSGSSPGILALGKPHPNPFSEVLSIPIFGEAPQGQQVEIHDVAGRRIRVLEVRPGKRELTWDGRDTDGLAVGSGVFFVRVRGPRAGETVRVVKLD